MAKILIVTDHKWRDLPGNTFLKMFLEQKYGHTVVLVRLNEERLFVPSFRPDMVIYNNLYTPDVNKYARYLHGKGVKIVILPTEGIAFSDEQTLLFSHKYSGIEFIDSYIAWNDLISGAISHNNVLPSERIVRLGSCRFDFYSKIMGSCRKGRNYFYERYAIPIENRNILVATNFANAEFWPDYSFLQKDLARQRAKGIKAFGNAGKLAKYEFDYREKVFESLRVLCREVRGVNIIIKYHPSERVSVYHKLMSDLKDLNPNVYLVEGEYIWDVLNVSDVIIQRCSTVAIEAWLMDKHTVELELMPSINHFLQPRYKDGSVRVNNHQDLVDMVGKLLEHEQDISADLNEQRSRILSEILENRRGGATEKIATHVDSLLQETKILGSLQYDGMKSRLKYYIRVLFGMKGYTFISNLRKIKFADYLGRYDKFFTDKDRLAWEARLRLHVNVTERKNRGFDL